MKKLLFAVVATLSLIALSACGANSATEELEKNDKQKSEAKVGADAAKPAEEKPAAESEAEEDVWTYYDNAKWSDNYNGLAMEIQKVVVTDAAPSLEDANAPFDKSAVGVKFKMENTTDGKFTFYPDQAVLVTSTGEQIDMPEMFVSDHIGGEIDKGVIKEGNLVWYLERGHAEDITWIKLTFGGHQGGDDDFSAERKEYEIELKLK